LPLQRLLARLRQPLQTQQPPAPKRAQRLNRAAPDRGQAAAAAAWEEAPTQGDDRVVNRAARSASGHRFPNQAAKQGEMLQRLK
jgi:hypothetical protein